MPIFSYFAVVGAVLVALLFVADSTLESRPPAFASSFEGLPKPWKPQLNPPREKAAVPAATATTPG